MNTAVFNIGVDKTFSEIVRDIKVKKNKYGIHVSLDRESAFHIGG